MIVMDMPAASFAVVCATVPMSIRPSTRPAFSRYTQAVLGQVPEVIVLLVRNASRNSTRALVTT